MQLSVDLSLMRYQRRDGDLSRRTRQPAVIISGGIHTGAGAQQRISGPGAALQSARRRVEVNRPISHHGSCPPSRYGVASGNTNHMVAVRRDRHAHHMGKRGCYWLGPFRSALLVVRVATAVISLHGFQVLLWACRTLDHQPGFSCTH